MKESRRSRDQVEEESSLTSRRRPTLGSCLAATLAPKKRSRSASTRPYVGETPTSLLLLLLLLAVIGGGPRCVRLVLTFL